MKYSIDKKEYYLSAKKFEINFKTIISCENFCVSSAENLTWSGH